MILKPFGETCKYFDAREDIKNSETSYHSTGYQKGLDDEFKFRIKQHSYLLRYVACSFLCFVLPLTAAYGHASTLQNREQKVIEENSGIIDQTGRRQLPYWSI
jgi:hypothetical protein